MGMIFPFILIFGIFYFLIIRPQQKQRKTHAKFLEELKRGDEVVTSSGIIGTVSSISDKIVTVEIAENVKIKVLRGMISTNAKQGVQEQSKSK
jgi:preprotein translocase subunit YajC